MTEPAAQQLITHAATTGQGIDYRTLDGRKHLVAPVVALVAGVVNGYLVQPGELAQFVEAWNGRPIPVRHPKDLVGYISANDPQTIERNVIGQFFGAHIAKGDRLAGEMWLDVEKANRLGGDALATLQRIAAGQPVEVSTAYFCDVEPATGTHDGKPYTGIQRNLRPDHLALLPDEVGACSLADGCGVPRVNQSQQQPTVGCSCAQQEKQPMSEQNQTPVDELEVIDLESTQPEPIANEGDGAEPETEAQPVEAATDTQPEAAAADLTGLEELAKLVKSLGGADAVASALKTITANAAQQKADLVATLTANAACAFTEADLRAMSVEQLGKLDRSLRPANYGTRPAANASVPAGGFVYGGEVYRPYSVETKQ